MGKNNCDFRGEKNPNYKGGRKSKGYYNIWMNMKQRCGNKNHPKYKNYGGRGISIHSDWYDFDLFAKFVESNGWKIGMQIDRIDNDGDYCPDNCQFLDISDNSRKKSTTKLSRKDAECIRLRVSKGESERDLAKEYGVVHGTIWFIINGYTHVDKGVCTEMLKRRKEI